LNALLQIGVQIGAPKGIHRPSLVQMFILVFQSVGAHFEKQYPFQNGYPKGHPIYTFIICTHGTVGNNIHFKITINSHFKIILNIPSN